MTPSAERQRVFAPGIRDGQVASVTGGGAGFGLVTAQDMTRLGAKVAICGRTPEKLAAAAEQVPGLLAEPGDIREPAQVEAFVKSVIERFGRVAILVTTAGGQFPSPAQQ